MVRSSRRQQSEAEVDSCAQVPAGEGRSADFGELIEPCRLVGSRTVERRCIAGEALMGRMNVREFGVDGAQAGVGELVLDVP